MLESVFSNIGYKVLRLITCSYGYNSASYRIYRHQRRQIGAGRNIVLYSQYFVGIGKRPALRENLASLKRVSLVLEGQQPVCICFVFAKLTIGRNNRL